MKREQRLTRLPLFALAILAACATSAERSPAGRGGTQHPSIRELAQGKRHLGGLFDVYIDDSAGKAWLALPPAGAGGVIAECLYVEGLAAGLGSNPVGLDRGQLGPARVLVIRRIGGKVVFELPNLAFRATSSDEDELRATRESFATSVMWAGPIAAEDPDGSVAIELTSFLVRDAHGAARTLERSGQGSFKLDPERSALDVTACLAFPENLEFEAVLTFAGAKPGRDVRAVAPIAGSITLVQHQSLLRLPDDGYRPRLFDPRAGGFSIGFQDYAKPIDAPLATRLTVRHRLERTDPSAPSSPVIEPIVYYVDRGAPEPVRSALIEGAGWWAQAFVAAGFEDAFRVELLPEGASPFDARYNVIQWVHRSTRGWSYGGGITDPRTGEMIKGHVSLGSLRVRQDRLIFEGLAGAEQTGSGAPDDPVELALARIRQLSAHEVGHTLGLAHNFAASTYDGRASVMDYPAPLVRLAGGELDFSAAYATGIGSWDELAIRCLYTEFAPGTDEAAELDALVRAGIAGGMRYLSDADARPAGAANPWANLWDNGADPVAELARVLAVRRVALARFGARNLLAGMPLASLQEVLAPLYFYHRYQLDAALKSVGGLDYRYALGGSDAEGARILTAEEQRRALDAVLAVLEPEVLDLPEGVLALLLPRPPGYSRNREMFASRTSPAFDALGAAATAADQVVTGLLQPERAARLVDFHRRDPALPGLGEVVDALVARTSPSVLDTDPRRAALRREVRRVVVNGLMRLATDPRAPAAVREIAEEGLARHFGEIARVGSDPDAAAMDRALVRTVQRFLGREWAATGGWAVPEDMPPGSPIGTGLDFGDCRTGAVNSRAEPLWSVPRTDLPQ